MNTITKRITAFGITGAAASALIIGVAPAQAFDGDRASTVTSAESSSSQSHTDLINDLFTVSGTTGNGVLGNDTSLGGVFSGGVVNGGVGNGGVVNGPLVEDSLNGYVASGNEVAKNASVGSGNDVSAPVTAPVEAPVTAPVDAPVDTPVEAPIGNGTSTDVGGVDADNIDASVDTLVDDVLGGLGWGLGR